MTLASEAQLRHPDRFFIDGTWVAPSSGALLDVVDSNTEEVFLRVAEARAADLDRAVTAARRAFDDGPWPLLTHQRRAEYLRAMAAELRTRSAVVADLWPRESGALFRLARHSADIGAATLERYADLAADYSWEEPATPTAGGRFGLLIREPVGVVGAIVPWNLPLELSLNKLAPALLAGCAVVLKAAPEAPGEPYVLAEVAEAVGLPPGVLNVLTAGREVSELLVRDHRVDKIAFTGSTAAGRRIGAIMGERVGRFTLELGGKSAAVILDDADLGAAAATIAASECLVTGQTCASLTRLVVVQERHDEFVDALVDAFAAKRVGNAFDRESQMGPLAMERQRDRVEDYIAKGITEGGRLVAGGRRPAHLDRGYFIEPTVFAGVDNSSTIAQEEIFGPVLSVIPAAGEADAVRIANDTVYGLNASVFTHDVDRARAIAGRLRCGTVGHNALRVDFGIAFGGFKQSGVGREGGREGLLPYLETKTVILEDTPERYRG
ncbi:aldehyde dehydrogenase [Frankia sp. CNm7]|uniref:Aldehyde dehydrogenase n=1 Tax=Frankia nepalensis TaxID=1836974 RepID=A0A937RH51_9ACTN|nr:aldehyde dehydrogenase [Frankia nepalensis]MBL7499159.1 aldehyde dehydrogenase [Frankia nepalensis]MBL7511023.1 aldehyde dehydrogenase [Frankia nepalensis]MBL7520509.1 aldehyde dehydrogenase [Frankia nepalensis]MBL7632103.1 aldehyde dehydrogenase [Frankia nepalensis]